MHVRIHHEQKEAGSVHLIGKKGNATLSVSQCSRAGA